MTESRISSPKDFPDLVVYRRDEESGPVYRVGFWHKEFGTGWRRIVKGLTCTLLVMLAILSLPGSGFLTSNGAPQWVAAGFIAVAIGLPIVLWRKLMPPYNVFRSIELDMGKDSLRVLNGERLELQRRLSRLRNLTVEDHPDVEYARLARQEKREKRLREEERQHCLFGFFGERGAEKVQLLSRAEWPTRHSLFQVQQAILWAIEQASARAMAGAGAANERPAQGLNPPLD